MSNSITVASPPSTVDSTAAGLAYMAAQLGVETDYNHGSQIRTILEAAAAVGEEQGIIAQALAFQAMVYACYAAFDITPLPATPAVGAVTFSTGTGSTLPTASQSVLIASGTVVQTTGGVQFQTTGNVTLAQGGTSVNASIIAMVAGTSGNQSAGTITKITSGLSYPLFVSNTLPTTGGAAAETPAQTFARFTAAVAAIGLASPVSIANAVIGVDVSGEVVKYATCYEPWIAAGSGVGSGTAGFTVYVDNGSGTASSALISAVQSLLNGSFSGGQSGYRPAGVPYSVAAVNPVEATVIITATLSSSSLDVSYNAPVSDAVEAYFASLQFGQTCEQTQIIAAAANALLGVVVNLSVILEDSTGTPQITIAASPTERVILSSLQVTLS